MRKVAIVAKAATSALAPWRDTEWEIWGLPWISCPRVDRYFDTHDQSFYGPGKSPDPFWSEEKWLGRLDGKIPVYTFESRAHLPGAVVYPLAEVCQSIPIPYFENSIAYMMALAIHERVDVLGLWGVHMRGASEYEAERPSIAYLVGLAQGRGIEVVIPPGNPLMASVWEAGRYGVNLRRRSIHPGYTSKPF